MRPPHSQPLNTIRRYALFSLEDPWRIVLLKEPGTRLGHDPEELHDMRVGVRRVRTGVAIFRRALPESLVALQSELAWLGAALGGTRDFDVLIDHIKEAASRLPLLEDGILERIVARLEVGRQKAREEMLEALDSGRWVDLQFAMSEALDQWPQQDSSGSAAIAMRRIVRKLHDRFEQQAEEMLKKPTAEGLHRLRIRAKRLRYAATFSSRLFGEAAVAYAKGLGKLQDVLGQHQDAAVAQEQLRLLIECESVSRADLFGAGILAQGFQAMAEDSLHKWRAALDLADGSAWRDLRRVMREAADEARAHEHQEDDHTAQEEVDLAEAEAGSTEVEQAEGVATTEDEVNQTEDHPPKG